MKGQLPKDNIVLTFAFLIKSLTNLGSISLVI